MTLVERTDVRVTVTVQPEFYRQSVEHGHEVERIAIREKYYYYLAATPE
jgi:hypothetical protein